MVLAEGPVGYARLARAISEAQLAGEKGAPRTTIAAASPTPPRAACTSHPHAERAATTRGSCSPAAARARCPAALVRDGPAAARRRARRARRRVRSRPRARGAVGPRRPARPPPQRRARRRSRRPRASTSSPPTTCTTPRPRSARSPPRSPRSARAARSTRSTAGCPPSPFAHLRSAARAGAPLRALARRGGAHGRDRACVRVRPAPRRARAARPRRARPATPR